MKAELCWDGEEECWELTQLFSLVILCGAFEVTALELDIVQDAQLSLIQQKLRVSSPHGYREKLEKRP